MTSLVIISGLDRRERLLQFIETLERVTITEICDEFLMSPATIRRGLEALELSGHLRQNTPPHFRSGVSRFDRLNKRL